MFLTSSVYFTRFADATKMRVMLKVAITGPEMAYMFEIKHVFGFLVDLARV